MSLPIQPIVNSIVSILGKTTADLGVKTDVLQLPVGVTVDVGGVHVKVDCDKACAATASGVIDLGGGATITLQPGSVDLHGTGTANLGLGLWPQEWAKLQGVLQSGKCTVLSMRMRLRNDEGEDRVVSYALPVCGTKVTMDAKRDPVATADKVTRRLATTVTCSQKCALTARFLQVKSGNTVIVSQTKGDFNSTDGTGKTWSGIWKLSTADAAAIRKARAHGFGRLRYVVSANAAGGGVTTVGSATVRAKTR